MATPDPAPALDFRPTHVVPPDGLPAWEAPDAARPTDPLDALLPVQLAERRGDWAYVVCSNGWAAWVDGRLLVSVPRTPRPPVSRSPARRTRAPAGPRGGGPEPVPPRRPGSGRGPQRW